MQRIDNLIADESYSIVADSFTIETDKGVLSNRAATQTAHSATANRISFDYTLSGKFNITLDYVIRENRNYVERRLLLNHINVPLAVLKVELGRTKFETPPAEAIRYDTFWYAPTVSFLRWKNGGLFAGIENPFFTTSHAEKETVFSYEPSLLLKPGDTYETEPQFIGTYRHSGRMIANEWPRTALSSREGEMTRPRFINPSGRTPLDFNEIQGMRRFAADYLDLKQKSFRSILYMYWYPIEQYPGPAQEAKYCKMIDQFQALGGDTIIFNPLVRYGRPTGDPKSFWELAPPKSPAERILAHADRAGMKYGFYMGVAHTGDRGNASGLPFVPEQKDWKKLDALGCASGENCMACDPFADWWLAVQKNTIERYHLGLWSWDPGPGHGFYCYSDKHGHIPGKGGYKGWRNATELIRKLKVQCPELYLMAYYGRKEYGLWGLKYFDQQESYWEQTVNYDATLHPDLHDDRVNADGARLQSWWNENFRFLPTEFNHALTFRIGEHSFDPRLTQVWDHLGWKYSLLSGIASSGSITADILPEDVAAVPGMREFHAKWLGWARENYGYVKYNISSGAQVRTGGVDVHARIKGDHGFIFLCNPADRPAKIALKLDETLGLAERNGHFTLKELHPCEGRMWLNPTELALVRGEQVVIEVPSREVMVLELRPLRADELPLVTGIGGQLKRDNNELRITDASGQPGERAVVSMVTARGMHCTVGTDTKNLQLPKLWINGKPAELIEQKPAASATIQFAGTSLPRALDDWKTEEGKPFAFPFHPAATRLALRTTFTANPAIRKILESAKPANLAEVAPLIEHWRRTRGLPHNFAWARPDRLWLVLPFTDAGRVGEVKLKFNGQDLPVTCFSVAGAKVIHFADLTDLVKWGKPNELSLELSNLPQDQFLGPYLDYPPAPPVSQWALADSAAPPRVVFDRPIGPVFGSDLAVTRPEAPVPKITSANMDPPILGGRPVTLFASVDMPPEELRGVYASAGWIERDLAMRYDRRTNRWSLPGGMGRPMPILDGNRVCFWAISKEGRISAISEIELKKLFGPWSPEAAAAALQSPWPNVRRGAREALMSIPDPRAAAMLKNAAEKAGDDKP